MLQIVPLLQIVLLPIVLLLLKFVLLQQIEFLLELELPVARSETL